MTLIQFKPSDVEMAKGAVFLDDMDTIYSPHGGYIVAVAMKHGVHVCWQCGEPFVPEERALALVEKITPGATTPCGVHRKCISGKVKGLYSVTRGLEVRRALARAAKATASLLGIQEEVQEAIPVPDPIPRKPADPDWRFKRMVDGCPVTFEDVTPAELDTEKRWRASMLEIRVEVEGLMKPLSREGKTRLEAELALRDAALEFFKAREAKALEAATAAEAPALAQTA